MVTSHTFPTGKKKVKKNYKKDADASRSLLMLQKECFSSLFFFSASHSFLAFFLFVCLFVFFSASRSFLAFVNLTICCCFSFASHSFLAFCKLNYVLLFFLLQVILFLLFVNLTELCVVIFSFASHSFLAFCQLN